MPTTNRAGKLTIQALVAKGVPLRKYNPTHGTACEWCASEDGNAALMQEGPVAALATATRCGASVCGSCATVYDRWEADDEAAQRSGVYAYADHDSY